MTTGQLYLNLQQELMTIANKYQFLYEHSSDEETRMMYLHKLSGIKDACRELLEVMNTGEQNEPVSPFTGGLVLILEKDSTVKYRGEEITVKRKYYRCADTGREFADSKLDDDFMWEVFRKYCSIKNYETFTDIEKNEILNKASEDK